MHISNIHCVIFSEWIVARYLMGISCYLMNGFGVESVPYLMNVLELKVLITANHLAFNSMTNKCKFS